MKDLYFRKNRIPLWDIFDLGVNGFERAEQFETLYRQPELSRAELEALPEPGSLPGGSRMPLDRNPLFVGRAADLRRIGAWLKADGPTACPTVAITGIGGLGKSQLASQFAHLYGQFFAGGIFWLSLAESSSASAEVIACGGPHVPGCMASFESMAPDDKEQARRTFVRTARWLAGLA